MDNTCTTRSYMNARTQSTKAMSERHVDPEPSELDDTAGDGGAFEVPASRKHIPKLKMRPTIGRHGQQRTPKSGRTPKVDTSSRMAKTPRQTWMKSSKKSPSQASS